MVLQLHWNDTAVMGESLISDIGPGEHTSCTVRKGIGLRWLSKNPFIQLVVAIEV